jgi:hypothetical protein
MAVAIESDKMHDEMKEHGEAGYGVGSVEDSKSMKRVVLKMDVRCVYAQNPFPSHLKRHALTPGS